MTLHENHKVPDIVSAIGYVNRTYGYGLAQSHNWREKILSSLSAFTLKRTPLLLPLEDALLLKNVIVTPEPSVGSTICFAGGSERKLVQFEPSDILIML